MLYTNSHLVQQGRLAEARVANQNVEAPVCNESAHPV